MRKNKVDIITLGCSKNLVDSERLMRQFQLNGYTVTHDAEKVNGEFVVVNTCAFIGDAQEESINLILALGEEKNRGRIGKLFVMGCLSERFLKELKTELPFVDRFYGKFNWKELLNDIGKAYHPESSTDRVVTTSKYYAYLKIAEGCNRTCSYCSIPIITGKYRSRPMDEIIDEARLLTRKGVKEIQLIAQDLTYYGLDIYHKTVLPELVERLSDISGIQWIRLHYGYPSQFPHNLLRAVEMFGLARDGASGPARNGLGGLSGLTIEQWQQVKAAFADHEAWLAEKAGTRVEGIGLERHHIIEMADLVTEMKEVKHHYAQGVKSRKGIEV